MLKVIGVLLVLLIVSLSFNYAQFQKGKAKDVVIQTYTQSNKELKTINDNLTKDKQDLQDSYSKVIRDTKESDISFEKLKIDLAEIDCQKGKTNDIPKTKATVSVPVDPIVSKYYNVLWTAYSLQNKD